MDLKKRFEVIYGIWNFPGQYNCNFNFVITMRCNVLLSLLYYACV